MKNKLFQFFLVHVPKEKDASEAKEAIILGPNNESYYSLLAKDENEVRMKAARLIPNEYAEKLDEVEILVRPF